MKPIRMKTKQRNPLEDFDKHFHGDHKKLNKLLKDAGIPLKYPKVKIKKKQR